MTIETALHTLTEFLFRDIEWMPMQELKNLRLTSKMFAHNENIQTHWEKHRVFYLNSRDDLQQAVQDAVGPILKVKFCDNLCDDPHLVGVLPQTLTHLEFNCKFNQKIDRLPPSLTHLNLGISFNHSLRCLPLGLTDLSFRSDFNRSMAKLPASLTRLTLTKDFKQAPPPIPP